MRVLIACEESGIVRDAFTRRGHEAWSCDILPSATPGNHHTGPLEDWIGSGAEWDLIIGHPSCRYITNSGVRWLYGGKRGKGKRRNPSRWRELERACAFFNMIRNRKCKRICIENPIPHRYAVALIGANYDQLIQPWHFGEPYFKATCFWLKNLPPLVDTNRLTPPAKGTDEHKAWSMVHRASPGPKRSQQRSRTFQGIAEAMAEQWGNL